MNWAILFVMASIWLILVHVIMGAWGNMTGGAGPAIGAAPGQIASPVAGTTSDFSQPGVLAGSSAPPMSSFVGNGLSSWTDGTEARYPEDGFTIY